MLSFLQELFALNRPYRTSGNRSRTHAIWITPRARTRHGTVRQLQNRAR